jgi:hypothetical protein
LNSFKRALLILILAAGSAFAVCSYAQQPSSSPEERTNKAPDASPKTASVPQDAKDSDSEDREKDRSKTHVRLGTITLGASYAHYPSGFYPYWGYPYGFYGYGFYPALPFYGAGFLYDPYYWGFGYAPYTPNYLYAVGKGEIRISTGGRPKETSVYIDGAYAGNAYKLKTIWLEPGPYNLSLKGRDGRTFQQRIYVLSGKTLKIRAALQAADQEKN